MHLYEIAKVLEDLKEEIENGNIPEEAIADTLECVEMAFEEKADNIACIIKNWKAEVAAIKAEEDALAQRRKVKEREMERLTNYLADILHSSGFEKVETARNKISFRKNPPKVVVADEAAFIEWAMKNEKDYFLSYGKPTLNKTNIKDAIVCGEVVPGAQILNSWNIQIR
jgi:phage host-nuclease inhibitor protein Gam